MPDVQLHAYLDESRKPARDPKTGRVKDGGEHYVIAAAIVLDGESSDIRDQVAKVESELGFGLHYGELRSQERRRAATQAVDSIEGWDAYLYETERPLPARHHSEHHVRAKILEAAFAQLANEVGVELVVLETRAKPLNDLFHLDRKDNQVLQSMVSEQRVPSWLHIAHRGKSEAILAIADVVAGARSDFLCLRDLEAYPLVGHRVRSVRKLFGRP